MAKNSFAYFKQKFCLKYALKKMLLVAVDSFPQYSADRFPHLQWEKPHLRNVVNITHQSPQ